MPYALVCRLALVAGCATLAACAPAQWRRPDTSEADVARDLATCRADARNRSHAELQARLLALPLGTLNDPYGRSTLAPPLSAEGERIAIEESLTRNCMRRLGYALQAVPVRAQ